MRAREFILENSQSGQPKVYLDMDGVLADFVAGYNRVAGTRYAPGDQLPHPSQDPTLKKITGTDFFARLPKFASADALVRMVVDQFGHYNICSSPLRGDHENSAAMKTQWLQRHLQPQPQQIIITSRKEKHARQPDGTPNILVDDKPENIQRWQDAGGVGILYNAATDSLDTVNQALEKKKPVAENIPTVNPDEEDQPAPEQKPVRYAGQPRAYHVLGYNGTPMSPAMRQFLTRHIKSAKSPDWSNVVVVEYDPQWYTHTFGRSTNPTLQKIHSWEDFWNVILRRYFVELQAPRKA